jgi:hypothetical protein
MLVYILSQKQRSELTVILSVRHIGFLSEFARCSVVRFTSQKVTLLSVF